MDIWAVYEQKRKKKKNLMLGDLDSYWACMLFELGYFTQ